MGLGDPSEPALSYILLKANSFIAAFVRQKVCIAWQDTDSSLVSRNKRNSTLLVVSSRYCVAMSGRGVGQQSLLFLASFVSINGENRPLVVDEPVEFEK